ncbi:MAG: hypothetical protein LUD83_07125, partial [Clostridiales bacterium]|nr:hypothetical protein [Clostridiales bacterium]
MMLPLPDEGGASEKWDEVCYAKENEYPAAEAVPTPVGAGAAAGGSQGMYNFIRNHPPGPPIRGAGGDRSVTAKPGYSAGVRACDSQCRRPVRRAAAN